MNIIKRDNMCDHSRDKELPLNLTSYITFGAYPLLVLKTLDPSPKNNDKAMKRRASRCKHGKVDSSSSLLKFK